MKNDYTPSTLCWHEALDRSHVARDHFFEYVEKHQVVLHDPLLKEAAENVTAVMSNFYQLVGAKYREFDESLE